MSLNWLRISFSAINKDSDKIFLYLTRVYLTGLSIFLSVTSVHNRASNILKVLVENKILPSNQLILLFLETGMPVLEMKFNFN